MKNLLLALGFVAVLIIGSCGDGNVIIQPDPDIQAAEDSATIVNYLADLGYEGGEIGVTSSGVRYVILDSGVVVSNLDSVQIDESDIVTFNYTGKLLNDTIFDTSIQAVADSIRMKVAEDTVGKEDITEQLVFLNQFSDSKSYESLDMTYSSSGWTINGQFIDGFSDGISATFNKMRVQGAVLIVIPSAEAYGARGSGFLIPPNTIIAFELYPIAVIKQ